LAIATIVSPTVTGIPLTILKLIEFLYNSMVTVASDTPKFVTNNTLILYISELLIEFEIMSVIVAGTHSAWVFPIIDVVAIRFGDAMLGPVIY
jgi:hypothetical protein